MDLRGYSAAMPATSLPDPADYHFPSPPDLGQGPARAYQETLFRGLAHKLNNQISVAHGFSSLLLMQDNLDEATRENVSHIKEASTQMTSLLSRVLLLAGCSLPVPQPIDTADFLARLERPAREIMHARGVGFVVSASGDLPCLHADPARLRELLLEILRNAGEAAAGHGQVAFDIFGSDPEAASPHVDFFIRNSGQVWESAAIARAFEPFHSSKGSEHSGLGLPGAALLARLMGGRLGIHSQQGTTTVWVRLPVSPPAHAAAMPF